MQFRLLSRAALCLALIFGVATAFADERATVELVLKRMQDAVLAGDADAYLALVAKEDENFLHEQENWAKDLKTHRPIAFTLAIAEPKDGQADTFGDSTAEFDLLISWTMAGLGEKGDNLTRTTRFPVQFAKSTAGQWLYRGERWLVVESAAAQDQPGAAHAARVKFMHGYEDVAKRIVEVLPAVRDRVHEGFELVVDRVQEIKLYPGMKHLQASIYLSYVDPLAGWNEPKESIKLLVSPKESAHDLRTLLAHEYAHVATFEMGEKATDAPWWVLEGVADLAAEAFGGGTADAQVMSWAQRNRLEDWANLTDFRSVPSKLHYHVYKQGQHMLAYISDRFGRSKRNAWLRGLAAGQPINDASTNALGLDFAQLDSDWRKHVAERIETSKRADKGKDDAPPTNSNAKPSSPEPAQNP